MGKPRTLSQNGKKREAKKNNNLKGLWDKIKYTNLCVIGISEGEEEEQEVEKRFEEILMENFPNLVKEIDIQP